MATPVIPVAIRAALHAALGDPLRLAIVDELAMTDRSPLELQDRFGLASNLLAHHLDVLEGVGLIARLRSSGDRRRRYVHLNRAVSVGLTASRPLKPEPVLFVCTRNSARSQLAATLWRDIVKAPAESAGVRPAERVHPGAVAAATRAGLDLTAARPRRLDAVRHLPRRVVTVCDQAHEDLEPGSDWWHWSVRDPVPVGTARAFDTALAELRDRITTLATPERLPS